MNNPSLRIGLVISDYVEKAAIAAVHHSNALYLVASISFIGCKDSCVRLLPARPKTFTCFLLYIKPTVPLHPMKLLAQIADDLRRIRLLRESSKQPESTQLNTLRNVYTPEEFAEEILCGKRKPKWVRGQCQAKKIKTVARRPWLIPQSEAIRFISLRTQ